MMQYPTLADIQAAAARIKPYAHCTPVLTCTSLNRLVGAELWCKCENFQKVGAFKFRGACNAVFSLSDQEAQYGVATHSSGNHAAAVALAAQLRGIKAHIVMPDNASAVKKAAVAGYGGTIVYCAPTLAAREATLERVVHETGATFIHPYNDARVIAGQGTAALELLTDVPDLDVIMVPIGGGGLLSGTALVTTALAPSTQVIAAEPEGPPAHLHAARGVAGPGRSDRCRQRCSVLPGGPSARLVVPCARDARQPRRAAGSAR